MSHVEVDEAGIPQTLKEHDQWLCWRIACRECWTTYEYGTQTCATDGCDGEPSKVPINPKTGRHASSTDSSTWTDFETALAFHRDGSNTTAGIGYVFDDDAVLTGIDLDNVRDPETGELEPWAEDVVDRLDSWTEVSVSGTGLHIFAVGIKPGDRCRTGMESTLDVFDKSEIEMYDGSRYFAVTGEQLDGTPDTVEQRASAVKDIYQDIFGEDTDDQESTSEPTPDADLDDSELLEKARNAENGDKFDRLWRGNISGYESQSEADLALCSMLAFWTGCDEQQMDSLFRESGLMRPKWDEDRGSLTYGERTVQKACEGRSEVYNPGQGNENPKATVADEIESVEADGGVATETGDSEPTLPEPETDPWERAQERIHDRVAIPFDPPDDWEGEEIDKRTAVDRTANIYNEEFNWLRPRSDTRGWRATLYNYVPSEGMYEPHGRAEIERMIDAHLGPIADNQFVNEVVGKIERKARIRARRLDEPPERLVVANGILDVTTGELDPHTASEYHRTKIDIEYDPDAECEAIDEFFHDVVSDRDVPKLYRFIAHALYRGYPEEKAAMLLGEGRNGKTTFLKLVEEFLGEFNVSHESLKKLNEHEWAPARLNGKLANVNADMSDQSPDSMGMFKQLTGNDTIHGEVKFEKPIAFENHATMMFACNQMPVLHDDTRGNWRRWQLIQFPYVFDDNDPDAKDSTPKSVLEERLFSEEEFSGLLNRCVEEIKAWSDGREFFPEADSWETTRSKMRRAAEPVYDFAHICLRPSEDDDAHIPKEKLRRAYQQYATQNGLKKLGPEEFGKKVLALQDFNIEAKRVRDGNQRVNTYTGIEFTERGKQILTGSEDTEAKQSGLDDAVGRQANVDRMKQLLREQGGEMARGELFAQMGDRWDVAPESAESALEKAKETGDVIDQGGSIQGAW